MGKPAARIGDMHTCPMVSPGGVPHMGGPIVGPGSHSVFIEGQPAATAGDNCLCVGGLDKIETGSTGVYIEGKPVARMGDRCVHTGEIIMGSGTVEIGEWIEWDADKKVASFSEEQITIINEAIKDCIALLERKLELMKQHDPETQAAFMKWFGRNDAEAKEVIMERIRRALRVSRKLSVGNFVFLNETQKKENSYGLIYGRDKKHNIYLGDKFWKAGVNENVNLKGGVLIHELSHFKDVGKTDDKTYGIKGCLELAKHYPIEALINADSFQYFIEE